MESVSECRLAGQDRMIRRISGEGRDARQKKESGERGVRAKGKAHETSQWEMAVETAKKPGDTTLHGKGEKAHQQGRGWERFDSVCQ
jgi:hypothetical protein